MSGGSHNYVCWQLEENLVGQMHDIELNDLVKDLVDVAHDLEWWQSGDIGEDGYRKTVSDFKKKWFADSRDERLKSYIDKAVYDLSEELYQMLGVKHE